MFFVSLLRGTSDRRENGHRQGQFQFSVASLQSSPPAAKNNGLVCGESLGKRLVLRQWKEKENFLQLPPPSPNPNPDPKTLTLRTALCQRSITKVTSHKPP